MTPQVGADRSSGNSVNACRESTSGFIIYTGGSVTWFAVVLANSCGAPSDRILLCQAPLPH
eukprot:scaffold306_cov525-Prasinococcus_capsulatus_cf.AAC.17